jgi:hypothetical protein
MSDEQQNNTNSESSRQAADELNKNIDFFFHYTPHPTECNPRPRGKTWSTLHLLRQDITYCFENGNAIWPATMAIFAGIDLLAKYYTGDDRGKVGDRFTNFIEKYLKLSKKEDSFVIYQLRNSMLHSFGLYSEGKNEHGIQTIYRFTVTRGTPTFIERKGTEHYTIDVSILQQKFDQGVTQYYHDLRNEQNTDLRNNFEKIFNMHKYNGVTIG